MDRINPKPEQKILDVGFTDHEYSPVDNYLEKHYLYPENITALGIEKPTEFSKRYPTVNAVQYDGNKFPFPDKSFDICWSNAVLEHVGNRERQINFLSEINRVGKKSFITTPNRFFPFELHTKIPLLHFFPKAIFDIYLKRTRQYWFVGDKLRLLTSLELKKLLIDSGIANFTIIKNRIGINTIDFVIIFMAH